MSNDVIQTRQDCHQQSDREAPVLQFGDLEAPVEAPEGLVIGRTQDMHETYGIRGLANIGLIAENLTESGFSDKVPLFLDCARPVIMAIVGTRGSGKSNTLAVIAEELLTSGTEQSVVIIDPLGAFSALGSPGEADGLERFDCAPRGFPCTVLASGQNSSQSRGIDQFRIALSTLTEDDVALLAEATSDQQRALLGTALREMRTGYVSVQGLRIGPPPFGTLADLEQTIMASRAINEEEEGYAPQTRQSVLRRLARVEQFGILAETAEQAVTPEALCGHRGATVIDLSDPEVTDPVKAAVVAWVSRAVLRHRLHCVNVGTQGMPNTYLLVDESHMFVPEGMSSGATADLVNYAKFGRKAGCGLVLATQQPSATCSKILSQADTVIAHRLVFEADIRTLQKIAPAKIPLPLLGRDFSAIRDLPNGRAIICEKTMQKRPVLVDIRPRCSRHTGVTALAPVIPSESETAPGTDDLQAPVPAAVEEPPSNPTDLPPFGEKTHVQAHAESDKRDAQAAEADQTGEQPPRTGTADQQQHEAVPLCPLLNRGHPKNSADMAPASCALLNAASAASDGISPGADNSANVKDTRRNVRSPTKDSQAKIGDATMNNQSRTHMAATFALYGVIGFFAAGILTVFLSSARLERIQEALEPQAKEVPESDAQQAPRDENAENSKPPKLQEPDSPDRQLAETHPEEESPDNELDEMRQLQHAPTDPDVSASTDSAVPEAPSGAESFDKDYDAELNRLSSIVEPLME